MFKIDLLAGLAKQESVKQISKDLKEVQSNLKGFENAKVEALTTSIKKMANGTEQAQLKSIKLKDAVGNTAKVTLNADKSVKTFTTNIKSLENEADNSRKSIEGMGSSLLDAAKKMAYWAVVGKLIFGVKNAIQDAVKAVKELDDSLLELNKVVDITEEEMAIFVEQAKDLGSELNATASEVTNATSLFAKMGFTLSDSLELAEQSLKLTKIGDNIKSVEDATTSLISILKGFNLEASDASRVIDVLNEVSNNFAVGTNDITKGMSRVSAVLAQSNTTFEESVALFTGVFEILQNAEMASSGLVTISSRLRRIKEDVEDVDGLTVNLGEAFKEYAGIDLEKPNGELKSTYEIVTEVSKVWDTLTQKQQGYIAFLASGTRQSKAWNSLMTQGQIITEATKTGLDSAGSATEEFNKYLESMQGKLDELGATWNRIALDAVNSDFVDILLNLANVASSVVENIGALNVAFVLLATIFSATKFSSAFTSFYTQLGLIATSADGVSVAFNGVAASATIMNTAITLGVTVAIVALIKVIQFAVNAHKQWEERLSTSISKIQELGATIEDINSKRIELDKIGASEIDIALLEKELEIKERLLSIEEDRAAQIINESIPAIKDYNQYSVFSPDGEFLAGITTLNALSDSEDNLIAKHNALVNSIEELKKKQLELDVSTENGALQFEEYSEQIQNLEEVQLGTETQMLELYKTMDSLPVEKLTTDSINYRNELGKLLDVREEEMDSWARHYQAMSDALEKQRALEEESRKLSDSSYLLSFAFNELNQSGKISDETIRSMIGNEELLRFAMGATKEEIEGLAQQYGYSATDIARIQQQLTDVALQETRQRILALVEESNALQERYDTLVEAGQEIPLELQRAMYGYGRSLSDATNRANELMSRHEDLDDMFKTTSKSTRNASVTTKELADKTKDLASEIEDGLIKATLEWQDSIEEAFDEEKELLDKSKENWERLYEDKKDIWEKEYEDRKLSWQRSLEDETDAWKKEYEERKTKWERDFKDEEDAWKKGFDKRKTVWERDYEDRKKKSDEEYEAIDNSIITQIDALKEKKEVEEEIEKIQELQLQLTKKQSDLLDIQSQKNTRILTNSGWQWIADPSEIEKANEEISLIEDRIQDEKEQKAHNEQLRELERQKEANRLLKEETEKKYQEEKETISRAFEDEKAMWVAKFNDEKKIIGRAFEDEKTMQEEKFAEEKELMERAFEDEKTMQEEKFAEEKKIMERSYEDQYDIIDDYLDEIQDIETNNYEERIRLVSKFVDDYNAEIKRMEASVLTDIEAGSPNLNGATGIKKTGDQNVDNMLSDMAKNSFDWRKATPSKKEQLHQENIDLAEKIYEQTGSRPEYDSDSGKWNVLQYKYGGDITEDGMIYAHNREGVLTPDAYKDFNTLVDISESVSDYMKHSLPNVSGMTSNILKQSSPLGVGEDIIINTLNITAPNMATLSGVLSEARQIAKHGRM